MCVWILCRLRSLLRLSSCLYIYIYSNLWIGPHFCLNLLVKFQFLVAILLVLLSDKMHIHSSLLIFGAQ